MFRSMIGLKIMRCASIQSLVKVEQTAISEFPALIVAGCQYLPCVFVDLFDFLRLWWLVKAVTLLFVLNTTVS